MDQEQLDAINDLRGLCIAASEARRAGDHERARELEPSREKILAAFHQLMSARTSAAESKKAKATAKASVSADSILDMFN